jgi:hypothetical protein
MDAKQTLSKRSSKSISFLFKQYLSLIEDLKFEHLQYVERLKQNIPKEHHKVIDSAEYFNEAKMNWIRKRVLDTGNECLRACESELNDFSVNFVFKN